MAAEFSTSGLSDALVILGAAGIVIPAFARIRISPVIGFIMVGLLVGPSGLGSMTGEFPWLHYMTISNAHAIEPFAEFGIILLLFSTGMHCPETTGFLCSVLPSLPRVHGVRQFPFPGAGGGKGD